MIYPRWKYTAHKIESRYGDLVRPDFIGRVIASDAELETLGGVWYDTPAELQQAKKEPVLQASDAPIDANPLDERDIVIAKLDAAGIQYDKRWGLAKLKALLE